MMPKLEIDTLKIREYGEDVEQLAMEYHTCINDLFKRMYLVPVTTEEWVGSSAKSYADTIIKDKDDYINYGEYLKKCGNELKNFADQLDNIIENTRRIEEND